MKGDFHITTKLTTLAKKERKLRTSTQMRLLQQNLLKPSENEFLLTSDVDGGEWELLKLPTKHDDYEETCSQLKKNNGISAIFSGRKVTYLDKLRSIQSRSIESIVSAIPGRILIKTEKI